MAEFKSILFTEQAWMNSHLSVARYSGGVSIPTEDGQKTFLIVDELGRDLTQVSIPPGKPADLIDQEFIPYYKTLGRDVFIGIVKANPLVSRKEMKKILKEAADCKKLGDKKKKEAEEAKIKAMSPTLDFE